METEGDLTTHHVRRARGGDLESLGWVVERFSPLLFAQARYRLGRFAGPVDPEDLVQEVWALVIPRLPELSTRDGRSTPVLLRFLSTAVLNQVNNLLRKRATRSRTAPPETSAFLDLPDETRGPLSRAVLGESQRLVLDAIDELAPRDRELVVLRGIEQRSNEEAAGLVGLTANTCAQAYGRALATLRARLSRSVFDELDESGPV